MPKAVLVLTLAMLLSACSPSEAPKATDALNQETEGTTTVTVASPRPVITIGADPWCPHNCKAGEQQEGYMIDITREVFEASGYEVQYLNVSWARALQMTREGQLDAVVGAFTTDAPDFVFPDEPQGHSHIAMYTAADSQWEYRGLASLADQTLLAINGYSYSPALDDYIRSHADEPARVWVISGPSPLNRAIYLLEQKRADVYPEDVYVMTWALKDHIRPLPPRNAGLLQKTDTYIAFSPENERSGQLATLLSEGTARLRASGRIREIMATYGLPED
ncbi:ABC transporter substrate-binding protein [Marinobacter sp. NP-4(2019)]|uniref:substrate-binding periplasmic protein n=1 Tax=Marinobacter sp. NP-4(2019) TaxID=2488665 RepID=UPI000FC3F2A9|nr:transporter substrate-binding domain-containing protein [Marinobacter sp. NP-4(2019)]AZT85318.1 ABC transporter substrate-binding protein [Marinobacter sp. NP-4(2019)]